MEHYMYPQQGLHWLQLQHYSNSHNHIAWPDQVVSFYLGGFDAFRITRNRLFIARSNSVWGRGGSKLCHFLHFLQRHQTLDLVSAFRIFRVDSIPNPAGLATPGLCAHPVLAILPTNADLVFREEGQTVAEWAADNEDLQTLAWVCRNSRRLTRIEEKASFVNTVQT